MTNGELLPANVWVFLTVRADVWCAAFFVSDTTSPSDQDHGSGLWLWDGKAPLPPPQPASRVQQIPGPNVSALRRGGWLALSGGVALTLLGVALVLLAGHAALDAFRQASAGGYARGDRTNPIARRCARGQSRSSRQPPRISGRGDGHPAGSGANAVRAGTIACPLKSRNAAAIDKLTRCVPLRGPAEIYGAGPILS
jgi:hypothetical protein